MLRPEEIKSEKTASLSECDVCGEQHETNDCPQLQNGKQVENAQAPSRARLTLPSNLRIKKLKEDAFTIVVRENISCGTRFGPFEAQVVYDSAPQSSFPLKIFEKNGESYYLDTSNEEECNWMFFVCPAKTQKEQNLMAYQLQQDIYFSALRDIRIHEELKVWYAPHYAKKMSVEPPWPPDETEKSVSSVPTQKKVVSKVSTPNSHETPTEKSVEPPNKRGRRKKIYTDFVETPDLDDLDEATEDLASAREYPKATSPKQSDQREWHCSQCEQLFQDCSDFARHLREHYDPRKSGETCGKQKRVLQIRPKSFSCKFCNFKFSSNKRLQRHRLRLHWKEIRSKRLLDTTPITHSNPDFPVKELIVDVRCDEETVAEEVVNDVETESRHISDTDAASILLEIEANADKPDEGVVENGSMEATSTPAPVIVEAETAMPSSSVEDYQSNYDMGIEYLSTSVGEIKDADYEEGIAMEEHVVADNAMLNDVVVTEVQAEQDETMNMQGELGTEPTDDTSQFSCDICDKKFNNGQELYRHIRTHMSNFPCTSCGKGFARKELLTKHVCTEATSANNSDEEPKVEHICTICKKSFASRQLVRRHYAKHTGEFTCPDCGKSYSSRNILKSHVCSEKPEEEGKYRCEICHKTFSKESYLEKHIPVHTGAHACPNCGKWLRSNDSLNNHIRICFQVKELETNGSATCQHCKQVFTDARSFRSHMYDHTHLFMCTNCGARFRNKVSEMQHLCHAQHTVKCDICEEKFPNVAALNNHKASHRDMQLNCDDCGTTFSHREELIAHSCNNKVKKKKGKKRDKTPTSLQPLICEVCGALFSSTSSLNVHKRLHGEKLFSCDLCGKQFHRKDLMLDHCAVHADAAIPCLICNKMFKTKKSLDVHVLIHDGVKRYSCDICGKQFYQKGNLLKHAEVHNPERKHPCSFCSKAFSTKEYLAIHVLEHTRGRAHACDMCDKSFVKEHQLKAHQRVFHTNLAYVCSFCGLSVKLKHSLKRHLNKKHPEQRILWNNADQIDAMLVTHMERDEDEEVGNNSKSVQLVETVNQVQEGTEVLLAVAGIGPEALQQALASGTTLIQQGDNVIEISLPAENETVDSAFMNGVLEGEDELQAQIVHMPMTCEMEDAEDIGQTVDVIEQMQIEHVNHEEVMETQVTLPHAQEPFTPGHNYGVVTENNTIVMENGTILQSGMCEDDNDVVFYVLTTDNLSCNNEEAPS